MSTGTNIYYLERQSGRRTADGISAEQFKRAHILDTKALERPGVTLHLAIRALRVVEIFELAGEAAVEWYRSQETKLGNVQW